LVNAVVLILLNPEKLQNFPDDKGQRIDNIPRPPHQQHHGRHDRSRPPPRRGVITDSKPNKTPPDDWRGEGMIPRNQPTIRI
ncbi:hypothetical protein, partial [Rhizobium sp. Rhizsp42]|uniref:hypothetical protein n=1 Tax=Rhizobium sp. Rhizsp42 TaxID=3243034 RepID=UPI0039AEFE58